MLGPASVFEAVSICSCPGLKMEKQHVGSCKGRGLRTPYYHGFQKDELGNLKPKFCACCTMECLVCQKFAREICWKAYQEVTFKAPPTPPPGHLGNLEQHGQQGATAWVPAVASELAK